MEIVRKLAGYSMGRSDLVRRAMSKKKHKVMEEERKNFIYGIENENGEVEVPGCMRNGISAEIGNKIFDSMMDFASYAFNKSHAAAYAVIGFQTAFLMRYYPVEFIAAMLNSVMGNNEKVAEYIRSAEKMGIQVLPPDINESYSKFTVKGETIRFGLAAVKNVGFNVVDSIVQSRKEKGEFTSLMDFCNKVDLGTINKRAVESLIKAGGFDSFKLFRSQLLSVYEKVMDGISNQRKKNIDGQISLFGALEESESSSLEITYPNVREFPKRHMLNMEKEMTGLYISGHPLDEYETSLKQQTSMQIQKILDEKKNLEEQSNMDMDSEVVRELRDGDRVILGGIVSSVSRKVTRNNTLMAFIRLEDLSGAIEGVVFPKVLDKCNSLINEDNMVVIKGRVSLKEDEEPKVLCEEISPLERIDSNKVYIRVNDEVKAKEVNKLLKIILEQYRGETPVFIFANKERKNFRLGKECWINLETDVLDFLRQKFGEENIKVIDG